MSKQKTVAGVPGVDPTLPNVPLVIDGKTYHLCFDFNAIVLVLDKTGINLIADEVDPSNPAYFRATLWASLLREHPDMTLEQAGRLIQPARYSEIMDAVRKSWAESKPEVTDTPGND